MTFCVSHQKQLNALTDDDLNKKHDKSNYKGDNDDDVDVNVVEIITQSDITTTQQNLSMIKSISSSSDINLDFETNNVSSLEFEHFHNSQTLRLTQENSEVTSSPNNFLESTTEKLSLSNKSFVSESLTSNATNVTNTFNGGSNNSSFIRIDATSLRPLDNSPLSNSSVQNVVHHSKSTKLRGSSNNLMKIPSGSSGGSGGIRISGQKIEMPQLNNFFDHSEYLKKHEHGFRYGPHFETGNVTNITVQVGNTFYLHCRISLLQDKTVSWVRRKSGENGLELLTVGKQTYSGDPRYSVDFQYPNNWRLKIVSAQKIDEATYECQISTSPPRFIHYNVRVNGEFLCDIFLTRSHNDAIKMKKYHYEI
ncbi:hypothetical protein PVAND_009135 [Polypedilum vanderplanki]|uniref:Ig-like domain-containing protein n=1 Tax=Polypedilum vanderplanki TaxID=319348 RepID=A0A9J6CC61_POLVA|nr:hypothetical protein PVAND_009135 [Polypedilum vanderplanki]